MAYFDNDSDGRIDFPEIVRVGKSSEEPVFQQFFTTFMFPLQQAMGKFMAEDSDVDMNVSDTAPLAAFFKDDKSTVC